MPWKMTEGGTLATAEADGVHHPIWVKDDGTEEPFDPQRPLTTIKQLTRENAERRKTAEQVRAELEGWKALGVEPDKVRELMEQVAKKASGGDNKPDPKEAERVREQVAATYEAKVKALESELEATKARMASAAIGAKFASSPWFSGIGGDKPKTILPPDVAQAYFGRHFRVEEDGSVAGYLDPGTFEQRILIEKGSHVGDHAGFDEAIEALLSRREDKSRLLTGSGASGSSAPSNGHQTTSTTDVSKLPPAKRLEHAFRQGSTAR